MAFALYMTDVLASELAYRGELGLGPYNSWADNMPTGLSICPILVLSKLYANTALFGLNNRSLLRQKYNDSEQTIVLPTIDFGVPSDTQESHRSILASRSSHQQRELAANAEQDIEGPWSSLGTLLDAQQERCAIPSSEDVTEVDSFTHTICIGILNEDEEGQERSLIKTRSGTVTAM